MSKKPLASLPEYYTHILESNYIQNMNKGMIVPNPNQQQQGLSFNTGQMYNNNNMQSPVNRLHADGTQPMSMISNVKNLIGGQG